ncbi:MAG: DUF3524 domain-containing protein [Spirochaetota bacterium]
MKRLRIVAIEPFYSGSHKLCLDTLQAHSYHEIQILSLAGRHWKWRMHGGAITLAKQYRELPESVDLILTSSMLNLAEFRSLAQDISTPCVLYMHENQFNYEAQPGTRDLHYGFINYTSCMVADRVVFNSQFHMSSFLSHLEDFLRSMPDQKNLDCVAQIAQKSSVIPPCFPLPQQQNKSNHSIPTLLWNHRWEKDKNPRDFFAALHELKKANLPFRLILLGERFSRIPEAFARGLDSFAEEICFNGFAKSLGEYLSLLRQADILPVSSWQDFFGISIVEAIACGCYPILPKRLAYPEHIPEELHSLHLYEEQDDFVKKLLAAVRNFSNLTDCSSFVAKYHHKNTCKQMDALLQDCYLSMCSSDK